MINQNYHQSPVSSVSSSSPNPLTPSPVLAFTSLAAPQAAPPAAHRTTSAPSGLLPSSTAGDGRAKTAKSRKRVNTAEKRATHNAIERQRRETLNGRFLDLAHILPGLAAVRRPSKSAIVNSSISHLKLQREQRLLAASELRALLAERDALLVEVNEWRAQAGVEGRVGGGVSGGVEEVLRVESEVFGTFEAGFGNDGEEEDEEEEAMAPMQSMAMAKPVNHRTMSYSSSHSVSHSHHRSSTSGQSDDSTAVAAAVIASSLSSSRPSLSLPSHSDFYTLPISAPPASTPSTSAYSPSSNDFFVGSPPTSHSNNGNHGNHGNHGNDGKVASWAHQAGMYPLVDQGYGQNPFAANLLASIAAQQQRVAQSAFPPANYFPSPYSSSAPTSSSSTNQLDAWRSFAMAQYASGPPAPPVVAPSNDDFHDALRAGISWGLSMSGSPL